MTFNQFQRKALDAHAGGSFAYINHESEVRDCGDSLLRFIAAELSTDSGCDTTGMAIRRTSKAIESLQVVLSALHSIEIDDSLPLTEVTRAFYLKLLEDERGVAVYEANGVWTFTGSSATYDAKDTAIMTAVTMLDVNLPDWDEVRSAYGLDVSFQYSDQQVQQYTELYIRSTLMC